MERRKTYIIEDLEQLKVLADPFRIKLLERLVLDHSDSWTDRVTQFACFR